MEKKKVVIIGPAYPLRGGLASYDERLAREFNSSGYETTIYTFSLQYPGFLFPGTTQYSTGAAPADLDIKVRINSVNPLNWFAVGNKLKKLRPHYIIVRYWLPFMGPCLGTILRRVKKNRFTKVICIADNIIPHEKRPGDKAFTKYFIKPVDGFITMSEKVLGDLQHLTNKPSKYIAHPLYDNFGEKIDKAIARQHLGIADHIKVVLFFGFIRKYKGLDLLFEAIKVLKEQGRLDNMKFLVAGEYYEDEKPYNELIQQYGISNELIMRTQFIPDEEVKYYLCSADVVIQPYRSATQSGVTPLAYHFEVPMVVTNVGGLPSLVPDRQVGLVAEPQPASIADKLVEYFQLGENYFLPHLRNEKTKYSWSNMVSAITSLL
jgi:glycosyltransferase involved in cell wall biosynthesis